MSRRPLVGVALLGAALAGCHPMPVNFGSAPPTYGADDYARVHEHWTRHAHLTSRAGWGIPVDTALDAWVTLLSPDFRAAYLAKMAAMFQQTPDQRAALAAKERDDGAEFVEFYVEFQSARWEWGELASTTSVWSVTLVDDQGHELGSPEIIPSPERHSLRKVLFPPVTPFSRAWRIRFKSKLPDGNPVLGLSTRSLTLRFSGPLGAEEVKWESAK
jgi:hypothetical protein